MKQRPEEESRLEANHDSTNQSALSTQARLAKERAAREKKATARREKIESEKRIEQGLAEEREAKQLLELELELVAQMQRRREAEPGFSGLSELARDRESRATTHREHMQHETRLAEERETEELRKQYAEQVPMPWGR